MTQNIEKSQKGLGKVNAIAITEHVHQSRAHRHDSHSRQNFNKVSYLIAQIQRIRSSDFRGGRH